MGELQGYALLVAGIIVTIFVIPAIFRRNHVTVSIPADERYSANLRMLAGPSEYNARTSSKNRGTLLPVQPEVVMMSSKPAAPRVDAPSGGHSAGPSVGGHSAGPSGGHSAGPSGGHSAGPSGGHSAGPSAGPDALRELARARARKSALLAARQARLSRVLAAAGGLAALAVLLWVLVSMTSLPIALPILATLVAVSGFGAFGYLLTEARKASNADMADIRRMSAQLAEMGSAARAAKPVAGGAGVGGAAAAAAGRVPAEQLAVPVQVVTEGPVMPAVAAAASVPAESPALEPARAVARPTQRMAAPAPSYTVKPKIERRNVRPYVAPTFPTANVPYRPKELGEMFAPAELSPESASEIPTAESAPDFAFNLDDALDRRRA